MSKFVTIKTELHDLAMVKRALEDLKLDFSENAEYHHLFSGFRGRVPVLVRRGRLSFGLRPAEGGALEAIGDDMARREIDQLMAQVQQRYAYHKVLAEVEQAGFSLVEESTGRDQVIRMTVRRWS